ncbi:hypothetical protein [Ammoniphilus sp. CFH 90114]|uniref:hypothetical protein n=1 Tax=Ammoniphilus sp. CFH 90114 TaxID=2493665 RepID=UPI00100F1B3E|nr:hypothetical protein [Ammoniphilus sp. CFH 90114]RXT13743.1 hypothetical protein EIZ39_06245 [Ammoniphilus sp. CFH 90114]
MSPLVLNLLPLILVIAGIILRYSGLPDVIGFLLVTAGFGIMVFRKWMDKEAPTFTKYLYTSFLVLYIYLFIAG